MTTGPSYERVFDRLKDNSGGDWNWLTRISKAKLRNLIADAGLANQKAPRMLAIARRLYADFGTVSLTSFASRDDNSIEAYLTSLPGVGMKTAKCVMMYAMGRDVLPVDTHVQRVSMRLGFVPVGALLARAHEMLEELIPPPLRYDFHVNAVAHGRAICKAINPRCRTCVISRICPSKPSLGSRPRLHVEDTLSFRP
jgi:endonuclease III